MEEKNEEALNKKMRDWINHLEEMRQDNLKQFDKQIVYLSGGGLVLSIGFVKDIIGFDSIPDFKYLLILSWICFTFSLTTNLFAFKTASASINNAMVFNEKLMKLYDKITSFLNWISIFGLISGLIFFIIFATVNF
jgi:hypothetical protein